MKFHQQKKNHQIKVSAKKTLRKKAEETPDIIVSSHRNAKNEVVFYN